MSKIINLKINHYRGIEIFEQYFGDKNCVVLIGRGDSGKTTILKAISAVLSPVWNTTFTDFDFTDRDTSKPIIIEAVIADVPEELLKLDKYGEYYQLQKNETIVPDIEDADANQGCKVLKVRLTVDETLEPKWFIVSDREIGKKSFTHSDRAKLNMFMVSDYVENHFSYTKGSPLYSFLRQNLDKESRTSTGYKLTEIAREIYKEIIDSKAFDEFDETTKKIKENAQSIGLTINDLKTLIEFKENAYTESSITLHSDDIPYRFMGKGSKRLLSIAIQYSLVESGGIILIDEIEQGLESDRVRNLTRMLARGGKGQIFITTHSKDVILEPQAEQIFLMKKGANKLTNFGEEFQGLLRIKPEAFFAKRIISCEGATEEGIIRAFNDDLVKQRGYSIAVQGIVHIDGGGNNKFYKYANSFYNIGIDSMVFCDDDVRELDEIYEKTNERGIKVVKCDHGLAIEQQLFNDLPWEAICELVKYAMDEYDGEKTILPPDSYPEIATIEDLVNADDSKKVTVRKELSCRAANNKGKNGSWYKNINHGEFLGRIWLKYINQLDSNCTLKREYDEIISWIGNDIN